MDQTEKHKRIEKEVEVVKKYYPSGELQEVSTRTRENVELKSVETREKKLEMEMETAKEQLALKMDAFNHIQTSHRPMSEQMYEDSKYVSYVLKRTLALSHAALHELVDPTRLREWMTKAGSFPEEYGPFDADILEDMERSGGTHVSQRYGFPWVDDGGDEEDGSSEAAIVLSIFFF